MKASYTDFMSLYKHLFSQAVSIMIHNTRSSYPKINDFKIFLHILVLSLKFIKKSEYPFTYKRHITAAVLTSLGKNY